MTSPLGYAHMSGPVYGEQHMQVPVQPLVRETAEEHRARMEAKGAHARSFLTGDLAATKSQISVRSTRGKAAGPATAAVEPAAQPEPAVSAPRPSRPVPAPPRMRPPSQDEQDRLAAVTAYLEGEQLVDIARRMHRGAAKVRGWLVDAGVEIRPRGRQQAPGRDEQILEAHRAGATSRELAERFGLSDSRVRQIVGAADAAPVEAAPQPGSEPEPSDDDAGEKSQPVVDPVTEARAAIRETVSALMDAASALAGAAHGVSRLAAAAQPLLDEVSATAVAR